MEMYIVVHHVVYIVYWLVCSVYCALYYTQQHAQCTAVYTAEGETRWQIDGEKGQFGAAALLATSRRRGGETKQYADN